MATKMPWFRLYSEILDDKKIKRICRATSFNKATVIGVWVCLLALANESSDRGALQISDGIPYDINDLAAETEIPEDQLDTLLKMFERYDMLHFDSKDGWSILNWNGRQFKSDNVAERVAKHRANKAKEQVKRYSNVIDTDTESEKESDTYLLDAFCDITGLIKPFNTGTFGKWLNEVSEWEKLNVTRDHIQAAYEKAIEKDYTIARPHGLTNFIRGEISKKNYAGKPTQSERNVIWAHEETP
jgi:hypothetical protein